MDNADRIDLILKMIQKVDRGDTILLPCIAMNMATFKNLTPEFALGKDLVFPTGKVQHCLLSSSAAPPNLLKNGLYHVILEQTGLDNRPLVQLLPSFYTKRKLFPFLEEAGLRNGIVKIRLWDYKIRQFVPV